MAAAAVAAAGPPVTKRKRVEKKLKLPTVDPANAQDNVFFSIGPDVCIIHKLCEKHTELDIISDSMSNSGSSIKGLFCCMIKNKVYLSEDYSFCERVNDIGGEVWISTAINLNHIGKHSFQSDISNRKQLIRTTAEKQFY